MLEIIYAEKFRETDFRSFTRLQKYSRGKNLLIYRSKQGSVITAKEMSDSFVVTLYITDCIGCFYTWSISELIDSLELHVHVTKLILQNLACSSIDLRCFMQLIYSKYCRYAGSRTVPFHILCVWVCVLELFVRMHARRTIF